jgi:hypothetical protein
VPSCGRGRSSGSSSDQPQRYHAILDVNPIAAPGSGESEYQDDYFPINLTSLFFDNDQGHTCVTSPTDSATKRVVVPG